MKGRPCADIAMTERKHSVRTVWLLSGVIAGTVACATSSISGVTTAPAAIQATGTATGVPNLYDAQRLVADYISGGRYEQDVAKVAADARAWLEERAKTAAKPAIVLDIDETSLSNWPAYRINGWARIVNGPCDLQQGPCGLRAWQALGQSQAIAPTLALARRARELAFGIPGIVAWQLFEARGHWRRHSEPSGGPAPQLFND